MSGVCYNYNTDRNCPAGTESCDPCYQVHCDDDDACTMDSCSGAVCSYSSACDDPACVGDAACNAGCGSSTEDCGDGIDNDCDGSVDCDDTDCVDDDACVCIPSTEDCGDGIDNDCDGSVDCGDTDCADAAACGCSDCWIGTSGPCQHPSNGVCYRYLANGNCPTGTDICNAPSNDAGSCEKCWPGSSGTCQHPSNRVCYEYLANGNCPTGTNNCGDSPVGIAREHYNEKSDSAVPVTVTQPLLSTDEPSTKAPIDASLESYSVPTKDPEDEDFLKYGMLAWNKRGLSTPEE
jgi:hypothetical protein